MRICNGSVREGRLFRTSRTRHYWSADEALALPAGTHQIRVFAAWNSGADATVSSDATSVLQGSLTVSILKQ